MCVCNISSSQVNTTHTSPFVWLLSRLDNKKENKFPFIRQSFFVTTIFLVFDFFLFALLKGEKNVKKISWKISSIFLNSLSFFFVKVSKEKKKDKHNFIEIGPLVNLFSLFAKNDWCWTITFLWLHVFWLFSLRWVIHVKQTSLNHEFSLEDLYYYRPGIELYSQMIYTWDLIYFMLVQATKDSKLWCTPTVSLIGNLIARDD